MSDESFSSVSTIYTSTPKKIRAKRVCFEEGEIDISMENISAIHLAIDQIYDKRIDETNKTFYLIKWICASNQDESITWVAEDDLYCTCETEKCLCYELIKEFNKNFNINK